MELKDLHPNDYYFAEYESGLLYPEGRSSGRGCIVKGSEVLGGRPNIFINPNMNMAEFIQNNMCTASKNVRLATPQEIHWLDCCINNCKFISYENAMLTFTESINYQQDFEYNNILIKLLTQ